MRDATTIIQTEISDCTYMMKQNELGQTSAQKYDQYYYGNGKVLLTGEYFILDGAQGLALPTRVGQSMGVRYEQSYSPKLNWKAFDVHGDLWLESNFEFWHFNCLDENPTQEALELRRILRHARFLNKHFLRDNQSIFVETRLGFPRQWGLGSSSTLLYNMAQWAYTSAFELAQGTFGGSGYDIACAGSEGPIIYHLEDEAPNWSTLHFYPPFHENLFFVHLGTKQCSREGILRYRSQKMGDTKSCRDISLITSELVNCSELEHFNELMRYHEEIVSKAIGIDPIGEKFADFNGQLKSLGAWGGDFILASSKNGKEEVSSYFAKHGLETVISLKDFVLGNPNQVVSNIATHMTSDILQ